MKLCVILLNKYQQYIEYHKFVGIDLEFYRPTNGSSVIFKRNPRQIVYLTSKL